MAGGMAVLLARRHVGEERRARIKALWLRQILNMRIQPGHRLDQDEVDAMGKDADLYETELRELLAGCQAELRAAGFDDARGDVVELFFPPADSASVILIMVVGGVSRIKPAGVPEPGRPA